MSRSAVFRYKGKEADPQTAGKALGVRALLTGRITQRGENLSVSAELVDTADNSQLWGEQYNRKLSDALAVQQEIARQISEKLRAKLGSEQMARMAKHQTDNPEAYQLYLKGRYYAEKFDLEDINKGLDYFHQAIGLDPNYALAYDGLVYAYGILDDAFSAPNDVMPKAREAARKAVEIDDSISESHVEMGSVDDFYDFDFAEGEREFKRAVELGPNYAPAHEFYSWHLAELGKLDEAVAEGRRAEQLDPVSYEISSLTGWWLYLSRRNDDAIAQFHKCLELNADYPVCNWLLGVVYAQQGRFAEAISAETKVLQFEPH
jgi:tetratricopeptide (TPR) repeat protein